LPPRVPILGWLPVHQGAIHVSENSDLRSLLCIHDNAFAQLDAVLDKVRQSADQVNANNPTYYLKSAKAVEPNICLYSNGDPSGLIGPLVFR
jgi:hypothetical protein